MTKSKKLISMLLAFVMLVTSCSLSFFAFAADSREAIEAADSAAEAALNSMSANAVQATDTAMLEKINALQDVTKMNPYLYAYALHVATTQILTNKGKAKNATTRAAELTALANGDATTKAAYNAILPVPQDYIDVIADFNALNAQAVDADYASAKINQIGGSINNLYYGTNAAAKAKFEAFWANYKDYSAAQIDFADIIIIQMAGAVSNAFAPKEKNNYASANSYDSNVNYYFAERHGKRFAELYYRYLAMPLNGTVLKNKYIKSNKWATDEAAEEYYGLLKDFYANANANSKAFYVNYFTALEDAGDRYKGLANAAALNIDAGLKLVAGEDVDFADIKAAYKAYDELSPEAKVLIKTISANVEALFNIQISNITMRENVKFGEGDEADSIAYLQANPSTMSNAAAYVGINDGKSKIVDLIGLVADEYAEYLPLDEYEEYVNGVTLEEYISKKGALPDEEVRSIALGICNGLRAVHSIGIVHRDINPNNVMLDSNGIVKIIDFGISRTYKAETHKDTHILGTQGYAAPEQYGFAQTGATADIYSLGVLINYMKTLALPGEALTQGTFRPIVEKCTKIDETLRYSSVEELSAAIEGRHIPEKSRAPGFRSNVWWHKLIASVYYLLVAFFYVAYLAPTEGVDYSENIFFLILC